MKMTLLPNDRLHMLVWRAHPSVEGDPGWRVSHAVNGCPITFGKRFVKWHDAIAYAIDQVSA